MPDDARKLLWKADELPAQEHAVTQRLNPNSHLLRTGLSRLAGLKRAHVSLGRIPPGKDSFAYHAHMVEEEWVYILSGRGFADIDGKQYEVGPGDFMGFPTPGIAHLLRNPFEQDLVYLMEARRCRSTCSTTQPSAGASCCTTPAGRPISMSSASPPNPSGSPTRRQRAEWARSRQAGLAQTACVIRGARSCGLLRVRNFLYAIKNKPHPGEHPKGASRRMHLTEAA